MVRGSACWGVGFSFVLDKCSLEIISLEGVFFWFKWVEKLVI